MTTGFIETPRFPNQVAAWAMGGAGFNTTEAQTYNGVTYFNSAWDQPLGDWNFIEVMRSQNVDPTKSAFTFSTLRQFHRICRGNLYGFRMRDFSDYQDDGMGTVLQLTSTTWQMYKTFATIDGTSTSPLAFAQIIQKPQPADAGESYAGIVVAGGGTYTVDYTTGIITKTSGASPTGWTGYFDKPCHLPDKFVMGPTSEGALRQWSGLRVMEIRLLD